MPRTRGRKSNSQMVVAIWLLCPSGDLDTGGYVHHRTHFSESQPPRPCASRRTARKLGSRRRTESRTMGTRPYRHSLRSDLSFQVQPPDSVKNPGNGCVLRPRPAPSPKVRTTFLRPFGFLPDGWIAQRGYVLVESPCDSLDASDGTPAEDRLGDRSSVGSPHCAPRGPTRAEVAMVPRYGSNKR
jgi:hypothetical protein